MRFAKAAPRSGNRTATGSARGTSAAPEGSDFRHASEVDRPGNPASAPAAGRIDDGETPEQAATREVREEGGVEADLMVFGESLANGMPLGVLAGRGASEVPRHALSKLSPELR